MQELWSLSAGKIAALIQQREISASEAVSAALQRMDEMNPQYNAVAESCRESALAAAAVLDKTQAIDKSSSPGGALAGVPVTVKVNIDQQHCHTTNGLRIQKDLVAERDSPLIANLRQAGAIIIARTNTPAFSMRWFTRNSLHGHTLNPLNPKLTPGGSSGGAASAVASGIGAIAHGTDIAGSIRYPAYACGIHGLRPSLGRIPVHNASGAERLFGGQLMAVSGPLARSIDDLELGFHAMAGASAISQGGDSHSARDPWWAPVPLELPAVPKRAALTLQPADTARVDPTLVAAMQSAAKTLADAGWEISEVPCPPIAEAAALNMDFWMGEMQNARSAVEQENDPDANFIFKQLERRCGGNESALEKPQQALAQRRAALTRQWQEFMDQYPILICPPSSALPFADQLDVKSESDFDTVFDNQLIQIGMPLMGIPAIHVTTGYVHDNSGQNISDMADPVNNPLPVGVQLVGRRYREDSLIAAAKLLEIEIPVVGSVV